MCFKKKKKDKMDMAFMAKVSSHSVTIFLNRAYALILILHYQEGLRHPTTPVSGFGLTFCLVSIYKSLRISPD